MVKFFKYLIAVFFKAPGSKPLKQSNRRIKAIIFDCDGVLVDSEGLKCDAWTAVLDPLGIPFTRQDCAPLIGSTSEHFARVIMEKTGKTFEFDEVIKEKRDWYVERQAQGVEPININFVKRVVDYAQQNGLKLALASSASQVQIQKNIKISGLEDIFEVVLSGQGDLDDYKDKDPEGKVNKPRPYIYQECAKRLGVETAECIVLEDTEVGVQGAVASGAYVMALPSPLTKGQNFSQANGVIHDSETFDIADLIEGREGSTASPEAAALA